jgi:hypothetical protein
MSKTMSVFDAMLANPKHVQVTCGTCNLMFVGVTQIMEHLDSHTDEN